jgi:hypothetical protein
MNLEERLHQDMPAVRRAVADLESRLSQVPGVRRLAVATSVPGSSATPAFSMEGAAYATPEARPRAARIAATAGFFEVLGVEVRDGRLFTAADSDGAERVAVVDEAFVTRHLAPGPALGRRIRFGDEKEPWLTIIGVVPSLVRPTQDGQVVESVYLPFEQAPQRGFAVLARTAGEPLTLAPTLRKTIADAFQDLPLVNVNSLAGEFWRRGWPFRLFGGLFLMFGAASLLLAGAGLYGVMAFTVRRRTQEIGVRMALGASQRGVLGMVLWQGVWRVAIGVAAGLWPGWYLGTQMQALLTAGISPADPFVHATTAATMLIAGTLATVVPALRASAVDPLTALRHE